MTVTTSPRSECGRAVVMVTSTSVPTRRAWPAKFTTRLFAVRPRSSLASLRDAADGGTHFLDTRLQTSQALLPDLVRRVIGEVGGGRAWPARIQEAERAVESNVFDQLHGGFEVGLGLARETDDEIG